MVLLVGRPILGKIYDFCGEFGNRWQDGVAPLAQSVRAAFLSMAG